MIKRQVISYNSEKQFTKVLILSDTHQRLGNALNILQTNQYDHLIHLGDMVSDAYDLACGFPELKVHSVRGNCDFFEYEQPDVLELTINGCKIIACHGHQFSVKYSTEKLEQFGAELSGHIILYGHSHERYASWIKNDKYHKNSMNVAEILVMNPGSISLPRDGKCPSFGLLEIEPSGRFHHSFGEIKNFNKNC